MAIRQVLLGDNIFLIEVDGRLDQMQNGDLEVCLNSLLAEGCAHLIVNMANATYINSGGLRCLVTAWRKLRLQKGDLVLCGLNTRLQEIFAMVGFDKVFRIFSDMETAQQALMTNS